MIHQHKEIILMAILFQTTKSTAAFFILIYNYSLTFVVYYNSIHQILISKELLMLYLIIFSHTGRILNINIQIKITFLIMQSKLS